MRVITIFALVVLGVVLGRAHSGEGSICSVHTSRYQLDCIRFVESEIKLWKKSQLLVMCPTGSEVVSITPGTTIFNNLTDLAVENCNVPTIITDLDQSSVSHDFLEKVKLIILEISVLPPGVFTKFTSLTNLDLSGNKITVVRASTFPTSLEYLDLGSNLIETIEVGAFNDLNDLQTLQLNGNKLTVIFPGTFSQLTDLEVLNLSNNKLQSLSGLIFKGLASLREISVTDNEINEIAADTFKQLPNLRRLRLTNNKLTSLPRRVFSQNERLWLLYLGGNKITHIYGNTFKGPSGIQMFEMDSESVVYVASNAFKNIDDEYSIEKILQVYDNRNVIAERLAS